MNDPMKDNIVKDLKRRLAETAAQEPPRTPINIGFGLSAPVSGHTSSSGSSPARFLTPSGSGPSGSADSWGSSGRPSNAPGGPPSPPIPLYTNPLYSSRTNPWPSSEIVEDDPPPSNYVNFRTAEVHHREPLTRPLPPNRQAWADKDPIELEPASVTVIGPDGLSTIYRQVRNTADTGPFGRFWGALRRIWPAPALAQAPAWFERWWNKEARRPAPSKERSTWTLLRAGKFEELSLDNQALLQIAAFLLIAFLVLFLAYMLYDSWVQGRQVVATSASGEGKPSGRTIYLPKGEFRRERARRQGREPFSKQPTVSAPSAAPLPTPDYAAIYEYPPRWVP